MASIHQHSLAGGEEQCCKQTVNVIPGQRGSGHFDSRRASHDIALGKSVNAAAIALGRHLHCCPAGLGWPRSRASESAGEAGHKGRRESGHPSFQQSPDMWVIRCAKDTLKDMLL